MQALNYRLIVYVCIVALLMPVVVFLQPLWIEGDAGVCVKIAGISHSFSGLTANTNNTDTNPTTNSATNTDHNPMHASHDMHGMTMHDMGDMHDMHTMPSASDTHNPHAMHHMSAADASAKSDTMLLSCEWCLILSHIPVVPLWVLVLVLLLLCIARPVCAVVISSYRCQIYNNNTYLHPPSHAPPQLSCV